MRLFGGERMQGILERVGMDEDEPLEAGMLSRSIESAQKKVEGKNFGIRKYVLQYDNVMNKQREIIYDQRRMVLDGEDVSGYIKNMTYELIDGIVDPVVMESRYPEEWDLRRITDGLEQIAPNFRGRLKIDDDYVQGLDEQKLKDDIKQIFDEMYAEKEAEIGSEQMREVERMILLRVVDNRWMDHIDAMDQLKDGIGLRGIGQQDPAVAYAQEGFAMFDEMVADIREETVKFCYNVTVTTRTERRNVVSGRTSAAKEEYKDDSAAQAGAGSGSMPSAAPKADKTGKQETIRRDMPKVGRNDPCPCGSGKKYKNCCGRNA
jgi:preprotein translocase subunit SecA